METYRRKGKGVMGYFKKEVNPTEGVEKIAVFNKYLSTLRPWDSRPSEHYKEAVRIKNYWYDHPPSMAAMLGYLFLCIVINLTVAFLPCIVNYDRFFSLWRDLRKPDFVYEGTTALICSWGLSHIMSSLSVWFVYLTGGWVENWKAIIPYFLMLLSEGLLADVMFGARRLDYTTFLVAASWTLCVLSMLSFTYITYLSAACLLPLFGCLCYLLFLLAYMWDLNGSSYEPAV
eukprot:TRINITY_DN14911_c0_g1_i1.p1 TRINITY_DN14911_c0_g1~~TRINITY_DN14911_c0_g1_i1.p1  ORF type:complete len:231 (+),score=45.62 TRINITY_DN14911_c0_g1_i1:98-790(+)